MDKRGVKDMTILVVDFNAKTGPDTTGYEDIMGTHGLGQMNENIVICRPMRPELAVDWRKHLPT
jgi:hypothetical protein